MDLETYRDRYKHIALERDERGIIELRLHTDGGPWQMSRPSHDELADAFREIALDDENEVVIVTGTGDSFSGPASSGTNGRTDADTWEWRRSEGWALMQNYLSIPVPVIAAINGPAYRQAQIPLLADIVLAADTAIFQDSAHFANNVVPGDGIGVAMVAILGLNRGRYFLLTGQVLTAQEAKDVGLVSEVLAPGQLRARAWEHAEQLMEKTPLVRRYTRVLLNHEFRRTMHDAFGYGLALQGLAVIGLTSGDRPEGGR
jgi:enoyl-CoA hydratase/carnithine racemase